MGLTHGYRKQHLRVVLTLGKRKRIQGEVLIPHAGRVEGSSDTGEERNQGEVLILLAGGVKGRANTGKERWG